MTLYQSDVVNPVKYYDYFIVTAMPLYDQLSNVILQQYGNVQYSTNLLYYPGFMRV